MAVRRYMILENSQVERMLVKLYKVFFSLETQVESITILFRILVTDASYRNVVQINQR